MSDLEQVIPAEPKTVSVIDPKTKQPRDITIAQIKVGRLPAVLKACRGLAVLFQHPDKISPEAVFLEHTDEVLQLLSVSLNLPREFVNELDIDEAVNLFVAVLEVNLDFFIRRAIPSVLRAMGQLNSYLSGSRNSVGPPTSSNSSSTDIVSPISSTTAMDNISPSCEPLPQPTAPNAPSVT